MNTCGEYRLACGADTTSSQSCSILTTGAFDCCGSPDTGAVWARATTARAASPRPRTEVVKCGRGSLDKGHLLTFRGSSGWGQRVGLRVFAAGELHVGDDDVGEGHDVSLPLGDACTWG